MNVLIAEDQHLIRMAQAAAMARWGRVRDGGKRGGGGEAGPAQRRPL